MGKQLYVSKNFSPETYDTIGRIEAICDDYQDQGYVLTTRQVYYQLVAGGLIENTIQSYKRVAGIINDAKLAGLIDWDALEDRTRAFETRSHWTSASSMVWACERQYHEDLWANQERRVFVVIEKEALVGVLSGLCERMDVPILAARGYPSGTVLRAFVEDHILPSVRYGQEAPVILHLGDHDPSGIDMSRDLQDRIDLFCQSEATPFFKRIALNMDQISELRPPENPAKSTDARYKEYRKRFGNSSWELDALPPAYLNNLVEGEIKGFIDDAAWRRTERVISDKRDTLAKAAQFVEEEERKIENGE